MEAHWIQATVGEDGTLVLGNLPFSPGQPVDVLLIPKATAPPAKDLRGSVLDYQRPFEPIASENWEALR